MSQCFACDNKEIGFVAMGKQVLTLPQIQSLLLGSNSLPHIYIAERYTDITWYIIYLSLKTYVINGTLVYVLMSF